MRDSNCCTICGYHLVFYLRTIWVLFVGTICGYAYQMEKGGAGLDKLERSREARGELEKIC